MTSVINRMTSNTRMVASGIPTGDTNHYCHYGNVNILMGRFHLHRWRILMLSLLKTKPSAPKQLISPVLASSCLVLMLLLHWLFPVRLWLHFPFSLAGFLLGGLGMAICSAAHRQFKKIDTTLYPFSQPEKLVTDGMFRYTRNPMYLGLTIFLGGAWLVLGSLSPGILVAAFLLIADRWYIPYEESQLSAVFGARYAAYRARTPRWI
jgi:protein-S-isoprenylcysteine O-methyltransferase Ste14